jgi:hypothetical protein
VPVPAARPLAPISKVVAPAVPAARLRRLLVDNVRVAPAADLAGKVTSVRLHLRPAAVLVAHRPISVRLPEAPVEVRPLVVLAVPAAVRLRLRLMANRRISPHPWRPARAFPTRAPRLLHTVRKKESSYLRHSPGPKGRLMPAQGKAQVPPWARGIGEIEP